MQSTQSERIHVLEHGTMPPEPHLSPAQLLERLYVALNRHDLAAFVECFDLDYQSEQPVHADRAFCGREQVRRNWQRIFSQIPDFRAMLLAHTVARDIIWAEWQWAGTHRDGGQLEQRGVTIFGVEGGQIVWGRLYMEPVHTSGGGIDVAVMEMVQGYQAGQEQRRSAVVTEDTKAIHRQLIEALFNQKNLGALDERVSATFVGHAFPPGFASGREGVRQFVGAMHAAFPDLHVTVDDLIAEGDKVVVRVTVRGTHRGTFFGLPPTGKEATWAEMHICRYSDGQWIEHWGIVDQLGLLRQLGAVPA